MSKVQKLILSVETLLQAANKYSIKERYKLENVLDQSRKSLSGAAAIPWLYHVTKFANLGSIQEHGLLPNRRPTWSQYAAHSKGKVFFTEAGGLNGWLHKIFYAADLEEDANGALVVLRVRANKVPDIVWDEIGSNDANADAFMTPKPVPPGRLQVWDGTAWVALEDADISGMQELAQEKATIEDDIEYVPSDIFFPPNTRA